MEVADVHKLDGVEKVVFDSTIRPCFDTDEDR
jgi:hypothetical protein